MRLPPLPSICFSLALAVLASIATGLAQSPPSNRPPAIILKLDDLRGPSPAFQKVVDYLKEKKIKCAIGIICKSLEGQHPAYFDWARQLDQSGLVEFWNHGWDHSKWQENGKDIFEFTAPYDQQKEHFDRAQQLGRDKLGVTFRAFNAGYGQSDQSTLKILRESPDMKVLLFGNLTDTAALPNLLILDRPTANMEIPTFVPNPERFKHDFEKIAGTRDVFVIQGHPDSWKEGGFEGFQKIVEYLAAQGCSFTTPSEYYAAHERDHPTQSAESPHPANQ